MWLAWLSIMALFYIYNAVSIFLRASFTDETYGSESSWLILDYIGDFVFLLDICLRTRIIYFANGQVVVSRVNLGRTQGKHQTKGQKTTPWVRGNTSELRHCSIDQLIRGNLYSAKINKSCSKALKTVG